MKAMFLHPSVRVPLLCLREFVFAVSDLAWELFFWRKAIVFSAYWKFVVVHTAVAGLPVIVGAFVTFQAFGLSIGSLPLFVLIGAFPLTYPFLHREALSSSEEIPLPDGFNLQYLDWPTDLRVMRISQNDEEIYVCCLVLEGAIVRTRVSDGIIYIMCQRIDGSSRVLSHHPLTNRKTLGE